MKIEISRPVGEIVNEIEESIPVFENMHIDYSFGGNRTLKDACYLAGAPLDEVVVLLEKVSENPHEVDIKHWQDESIEGLIDYIVARHHLYTWSHLAYLLDLSERMSLDLGTEHPDLVELNWSLKEAARELEDHLTREEELVFPHLRLMAKAKEDDGHLPEAFGVIPEAKPTQILIWEHGMISQYWEDIRSITRNYQAPANASAPVKELYRGLKELELDLHRHTHLENNVLFKKAIEMGLLK